MLKESSIEEVVRQQIDAVLLEDGGANYLPDDPLLSIGLNSLMLAQLLLQLESALGVDPFGDERSVTEVRTVGDLVAAYAAALATTTAEVSGRG